MHHGLNCFGYGLFAFVTCGWFLAIFFWHSSDSVGVACWITSAVVGLATFLVLL